MRDCGFQYRVDGLLRIDEMPRCSMPTVDLAEKNMLFLTFATLAQTASGSSGILTQCST
jgi:hypothetical protein